VVDLHLTSPPFFGPRLNCLRALVDESTTFIKPPKTQKAARTRSRVPQPLSSARSCAVRHDIYRPMMPPLINCILLTAEIQLKIRERLCYTLKCLYFQVANVPSACGTKGPQRASPSKL